jgi:hypothetical protein
MIAAITTMTTYECRRNFLRKSEVTSPIFARKKMTTGSSNITPPEKTIDVMVEI